jgi:hypothetical protein
METGGRNCVLGEVGLDFGYWCLGGWDDKSLTSDEMLDGHWYAKLLVLTVLIQSLMTLAVS